MAHILRGRLHGFVCANHSGPLGGITVKLYEPDEAGLIERAVASPKFTARAIEEKETKSLSGRLLAETTTDREGRYEIELPKNFRGGPVDVHLRVDQMGEIEPETPREIFLTTLQPEWREREDHRIAAWEYDLPSPLWCAILKWLGLWVVCGRVTVCKTDQSIQGVTVKAFDVDWLQDDHLGSDVTDSTGHFCIYYRKKDFTPGTWVNVELFGGPDLYFRVEAPGGAPLLVEPPSRGRQPDRENVGHCHCVELCLEEAPVVDEAFPVFTHVGTYPYATAIASAPGGDGQTSDDRAFFSTMRLNGILPKRLNGKPLEYCFEWQELNPAGVPITAWKQVSQDEIARTVIGLWQRWDGTAGQWDTREYTVKGTVGPNEMVAPFTADGFIQVPQESNWNSATGNFYPNGNMIRLISAKLVDFGAISLAGVQAGGSTTSNGAPLGKNRYFGLRMRVREAGDPGSTQTAGWLRKIAINNTGYNDVVHHPSWAGFTENGVLGVNLLDIQELIFNGCAPISSSLTVLVTAAHPNLGSVNLSIKGGNAASIAPGNAFDEPVAGLPDERFGPATNNFDVADLDPCAYILTLATQLLLTDGDHFPSNLIDQIAFCKH